MFSFVTVQLEKLCDQIVLDEIIIKNSMPDVVLFNNMATATIII